MLIPEIQHPGLRRKNIQRNLWKLQLSVFLSHIDNRLFETYNVICGSGILPRFPSAESLNFAVENGSRMNPESCLKLKNGMNKKQPIIDAALKLFASQGFDGTTTLQIGREAGVTEAAVFYYFANKDELFTEIIESIFADYFSRLDTLGNNTITEFEKIERLIELHLDFAKEKPSESYLVISTCPAKLKNSAHICTKKIEAQREWIDFYITDCLARGIQNGEFINVPIEETKRIIIALINGVMRQEVFYPLSSESKPGAGDTDIKKRTVEFCKRSLVR